jgi:gliding motility-associated-like protein
MTGKVLIYLIPLILFLIIGNRGNSQNAQDCVGAIPVCEGFYNQTDGYTGTGDIDNELPNSFSSCLTIDANSVWYVFTVESTGMLSFTLSPNGVDSDYDWVLFDFSTGSCDDISNDDSFIVSCNSYGDIFFNGPTGISSDSGGTGNSNGPGNLNGPAFNQDVSVIEGETYLLYIQDWSGNSEGYTLDFIESTASIFDNEPPEINEVETNCTGNVTVTMSESINCDNLEANDFNILDNGTSYSPVNVLSECDPSVNSVSEFTLVFDDDVEFAVDSNLTLEISQGEGLLNDVCGNVIENLTFDFIHAGNLVFDINAENPSCGEQTGSISIIDIENAQEPIEFSLNGVVQAGTDLTNLTADDYTINLTDDLGCTAEQTISLTEISLIEISAGEDDFSCDLTIGLSASSSDIADLQWTADPPLLFSNETILNPTVTAPSSGTYTLEFTATNTDGCEVSDEIDISFSLLNSTVSLGDPICGSSCDADVNIEVNGGVLPYSYTLDNLTEPNLNLTGICAGIHNFNVSDFNGCSINGDFTVEELESPVLLSTSVIDETCPESCNGSISVSSFNTSSISSPQAVLTGDGMFENLCAGSYQLILTSEDNCQLVYTRELGTLSNLNAILSTSGAPLTLDNPILTAEDISTGNYIHSTIYIEGTFYPFNDSSILEIPIEAPSGDPILIELIIEDEYGCVDSASEIVGFLIPLQVYIPNSFTPNNDNLNEVFKPSLKGVDSSQYSFTVFNRWGEVMFTTKDVNQGWNGNHKEGDHYAEVGGYHYKLAVKQLFSSLEEVLIGHVTLVR